MAQVLSPDGLTVSFVSSVSGATASTSVTGVFGCSLSRNRRENRLNVFPEPVLKPGPWESSGRRRFMGGLILMTSDCYACKHKVLDAYRSLKSDFTGPISYTRIGSWAHSYQQAHTLLFQAGHTQSTGNLPGPGCQRPGFIRQPITVM